MSTDCQGTKCRRNIAKNFNRLSRVHEHYRRQTDRQTDGRQHIANVNVSSRSLKIVIRYSNALLVTRYYPTLPLRSGEEKKKAIEITGQKYNGSLLHRAAIMKDTLGIRNKDDLWLVGHSCSSAVSPFDREHTTSYSLFSERELTFTFAICYRPSVCLSVVCRL